jgi:hypothetical protein
MDCVVSNTMLRLKTRHFAIEGLTAFYRVQSALIKRREAECYGPILLSPRPGAKKRRALALHIIISTVF